MRLWYLIAAVMLAGCASSSQLTQPQQAYIDMLAARDAATFTTSKAGGDSVWVRALDHLRSQGKSAQVVTEHRISLEPTTGTDGVSITKVPIGDSVRIEVAILWRNDRNNTITPIRGDNARMIGWYLKTGELPYPELLRQR